METINNRIKSNVIILIVIISMCLSTACSKDTQTIITQYGWHIISSDSSSPALKVLDKNYLESEVTQMKVAASKSIGLDPSKYIDEQVAIIQFVLSEEGPTTNLRAEIWQYKETVICAYLFHAEPNEKLKYWPLNTKLTEIDKYFGNESIVY